MQVKLANAPVSWGVDYADDPANPPWVEVMDEIAAAGFRFTELGPYGYYPTEPERLKAAFGERGLSVVAGFVFQPLHEPQAAESVLGVAARTIDLLAAVGGRHLVTIDHIAPERMTSAGNRARAQKLDAPRFDHMIGLIDRIADMALAKGIQPVVHQHAGCFIEFEDELEAVLRRLEDGRVGICMDTGHMAYAGIEPLRFFAAHRERIRYFHFKDIDPGVHRRVLAEGVPFLDAVAQKIFCPLGRGVVDWAALAAALASSGYSGAATVEQDIDPAVSLSPLADARASLSFLRSVGF